MRSVRRTSRRWVKLTLVSGLGVSALVLAAVVLGPDGGDEAARDPTRRGPVRLLEIAEARIVDGPAVRLSVRGTTNLVGGAQLAVSVVARGQVLLVSTTEVRDGGFSLETPAAGDVVEGSYEVVVTFRLEDQAEAVRAELGYQPPALSARRRLELPLRVSRSIEARDGIQAIFEALNATPRDPGVLDTLDRRTLALSERLWIAEHKLALEKLRLAIEEARRPELRRREFDRLLLEAHVLAGL